jgi:uncharacterized membrane protein HdeD (DUF308 family)
MREFIGRLAQTARDSIEARDVFLALGLALLALGLWQVYRPAAAIVPGSILVAVAIFGVKDVETE